MKCDNAAKKKKNVSKFVPWTNRLDAAVIYSNCVSKN